MRTINAVDAWRSAAVSAYSRALVRLEEIESNPESTYSDRAREKAAVYAACGAPFGSSHLAQWAWWEFKQWATVN